jgi:hypothetical protein
MASPDKFPVQLRLEGAGKDKEILVADFEIEYEDVFHLKNLYKRMYEFLVDEGWLAADSADGDAIYETLYWERQKPNESQEHHIWWRAYRLPEGSPYIAYFLKIDYQTLNMKKLEIMHKGQKFGTNKGDVILRVRSYLLLDYNNQFEKKKSSILGYLDPWFRKRMYLGEIKMFKKDCYAATYRFHTMIKQYLQFKPIVADWGRPFHPERGV